MLLITPKRTAAGTGLSSDRDAGVETSATVETLISLCRRGVGSADVGDCGVVSRNAEMNIHPLA